MDWKCSTKNSRNWSTPMLTCKNYSWSPNKSDMKNSITIKLSPCQKDSTKIATPSLVSSWIKLLNWQTPTDALSFNLPMDSTALNRKNKFFLLKLYTSFRNVSELADCKDWIISWAWRLWIGWNNLSNLWIEIVKIKASRKFFKMPIVLSRIWEVSMTDMKVLCLHWKKIVNN